MNLSDLFYSIHVGPVIYFIHTDCANPAKEFKSPPKCDFVFTAERDWYSSILCAFSIAKSSLITHEGCGSMQLQRLNSFKSMSTSEELEQCNFVK